MRPPPPHPTLPHSPHSPICRQRGGAVDQDVYLLDEGGRGKFALSQTTSKAAASSLNGPTEELLLSSADGNCVNRESSSSSL